MAEKIMVKRVIDDGLGRIKEVKEDYTSQILLKSPTKTWKLLVDDSGVISTEEVI